MTRRSVFTRVSVFTLAVAVAIVAAAGPARADDPGPLGPRDLVEELAAGEPTVAEVRAAAVRYAGFDPHRSRSWARRSRLSGLLPTLTARVTRTDQRDRDLDLDGGSTHELGIDTGEQLVVELRATWDLGRLVFDPSEIRAAREGARLAQERQNLESEVTRLYYQRRRARIELLLDPPVDPMEAARRAVEMEEMTANLDALTGGWFSREVEP